MRDLRPGCPAEPPIFHALISNAALAAAPDGVAERLHDGEERDVEQHAREWMQAPRRMSREQAERRTGRAGGDCATASRRRGEAPASSR